MKNQIKIFAMRIETNSIQVRFQDPKKIVKVVERDSTYAFSWGRPIVCCIDHSMSYLSVLFVCIMYNTFQAIVISLIHRFYTFIIS